VTILIAVELAGHVLGHFDMLHLIFADRDDVRAVNQNVRGHENGIGKQPHAGVDPFFDFFLVRDGPFQKPHVGHGA
jgi:hypothetical protein